MPELGFNVGDVVVTRAVEFLGSLFTRAQVFPGSSPADWVDESPPLQPRFWDEASDAITVAIQTFVLRHDGLTVLIDTGIGNGKQRLTVPQFHERQSTFLADLAAAGAPADEVDVVVCTHLHPDHVGWNTRADGGQWVPAFPNARYLLPRRDVDFWNPANASAAAGPHAGDHALAFHDSIEPVLDAGLGELWDGELRIDDALGLRTVPGHTPGSAVLTINSGGETTHFVGDLLATPMMISHPALCAQAGGRSIDNDPALVVAARRALLDEVSGTGARVVPAHFDAPAGVRIRRAGDGFSYTLADA
jgi:glyoxylase-like metal-dependent hydrolase (beta-lactamase superfamily II)